MCLQVTVPNITKKLIEQHGGLDLSKEETSILIEFLLEVRCLLYEISYDTVSSESEPSEKVAVRASIATKLLRY